MVARNALVVAAALAASLAVAHSARVGAVSGLQDDSGVPSSVGKFPWPPWRKKGNHYAVLIAGSAGWGNYRHQADIAHAYQILTAGGVPKKNIVTLMYDDIANNTENPHPGKVINRPGGPDVWAGVEIDYTGAEVTPETYLAVLAGNESGVKGKGTGRVLTSGSKDHVFLYFADHGGPGILGMPAGGFLHAKDLVDTLTKMSHDKMFAQLTYYVEACESGSIFDGLLKDDLDIYVMTAANPSESSWGYYCPGMTPAPPQEYNTCLGDLFSISFMEDSDAANLAVETLFQQYQVVQKRTSQNETYQQGSHVMQYGDVSFQKEHVDVFIGSAEKAEADAESERGHCMKAVAQHEADLIPLREKVKRAEEGSDAHKAAKIALDKELAARAAVAAAVRDSVEAAAASVGLNAPTDEILTAVPEAGVPVTTDWACYKESFNVWAEACGQFPQHSMKLARGFANLCSRGVSAASLAGPAAKACSAHGVVA